MPRVFTVDRLADLTNRELDEVCGTVTVARGLAYAKQGRVVELDLSDDGTKATGWVSGGFFAFNRIMIDKYLTDEAGLLLEKAPLQTMASDGELGVYQHEGFWMGMDTFRDWTELNELWDSGNPPWKIWEN